jgi:hypothetical protein
MERGLEGVVEGVGFEGVIKDDLDGVALNLWTDFCGVRVEEWGVVDGWTGLNGAPAIVREDLVGLSDMWAVEVEEETEDKDFASDDLLVVNAVERDACVS